MKNPLKTRAFGAAALATGVALVLVACVLCGLELAENKIVEWLAYGW
ncbi:MAG: hypothetical protein ACREBU_06635 [Nitrososphaera sp.]